MSDSLQPHGLYSPWNSPGQDTKVGSYSLLQGIFSTQGSNPGLPHRRWILYQLSHHRIHEEDRNTVSQHRLRNTGQRQHHTSCPPQLLLPTVTFPKRCLSPSEVFSMKLSLRLQLLNLPVSKLLFSFPKYQNGFMIEVQVISNISLVILFTTSTFLL